MDIFRTNGYRAGGILRDGVEPPLFCLAMSGPDWYQNLGYFSLRCCADKTELILLSMKQKTGFCYEDHVWQFQPPLD